MCRAVRGDQGSLFPRLQGDHPHPSCPGPSPNGTQVGTCGDWAGRRPGEGEPEPEILQAPPKVDPNGSKVLRFVGPGVPQGGVAGPQMCSGLFSPTVGEGQPAGLRGRKGRGRPRGRAQGQVGVGRDEMRRRFGGKTRGRIHPGTHQPSSFQVLPFSQKERFILFFL